MDEIQRNFKAGEHLLNALLAMGISPELAKEALFCTGNSSVDEAINYIFNNIHQSDEAKMARALNIGASNSPNYYKMVCVVNASLTMGTGKIASQVGHACVGLYRELLKYQIGQVLEEWEVAGEKKIVLRGNDANHIKQIYDEAKQTGLPTYLVRDAGRTQIAEGSITAVSVFGTEENVNKLTGKLELL